MTNKSPIDIEEAPLVFDKLLEPVMGFVQDQQKQLSRHPSENLDYTAFFKCNGQVEQGIMDEAEANNNEIHELASDES